MDDAYGPGLFEEIVRTNAGRPEILTLVAEHTDTPDEVKQLISGMLHMPAKSFRNSSLMEQSKEVRSQNILRKIQLLTVAERLQLAMKGGREIRGILIKDTNKEVMLAVLDNLRITDSEIEMTARSRSVPDEALRKISKNREWLKRYAIVFALVTNPKTPPGISITLVSRLRIKDLTLLEKNKNVPEVVRASAKKLSSARKSI